jgi:hypothetical protein
MFTPDAGFDLFHPQIRIRIKELKYRTFNSKNRYYVLKNKIRDVHPGFRILDLIFFPSRIRIPDSGVNKAPDPGSGSATLRVAVSGSRRAKMTHKKRKK